MNLFYEIAAGCGYGHMQHSRIVDFFNHYAGIRVAHRVKRSNVLCATVRSAMRTDLTTTINLKLFGKYWLRSLPIFCVFCFLLPDLHFFAVLPSFESSFCFKRVLSLTKSLF